MLRYMLIYLNHYDKYTTGILPTFFLPSRTRQEIYTGSEPREQLV